MAGGVTKERRAEVERTIATMAGWAGRRPDVRGVAVVGSWARGEATMSSDLDVVIVTRDPGSYAAGGWWDFVAGSHPEGTEDWGAVTAHRIVLTTGLEVELGIAAPEWAATDPLDPGTAGVAERGLRVIYDPDHLLTALEAVVARPAT